jgi:hypothetical protein
MPQIIGSVLSCFSWDSSYDLMLTMGTNGNIVTIVTKLTITWNCRVFKNVFIFQRKFCQKYVLLYTPILGLLGYDIVTWMAQQEVGGRVNSMDSRGDVTYPHSFHQYTTLGKHSLPRGDYPAVNHSGSVA